jgi:hypothetical protein
MPFDNHAIKLTDFKPGRSFDPARDRLQIDLSNGESVIVMYENRSDCIANGLHHRERYWLDHRRLPSALLEHEKDWVTPNPERQHAGFAVKMGRDRRLELRLVSQLYIGELVTVGTVVAITSVRSTTHTQLTCNEQTPVQRTKLHPQFA